jgi:hypothetical protein
MDIMGSDYTQAAVAAGQRVSRLPRRGSYRSVDEAFLDSYSTSDCRCRVYGRDARGWKMKKTAFFVLHSRDPEGIIIFMNGINWGGW